METVGIRELKSQLSRYVRRAEGGDVVLVTDRGRVVAELWPPGQAGGRDPAIPPGLHVMERKGLIRLATRPNDPSLYHRMSHVDLGGETIQDAIDFLREDR
jgi:antitoxin (DNA-binding transcriptional repressor) of toxin-antitoxin stability system